MNVIFPCVELAKPEIVPGLNQLGHTLKSGKKTDRPRRKDKRRKTATGKMTVFYRDGEKFTRVYTDRAKATSFAATVIRRNPPSLRQRASFKSVSSARPFPGDL